MVMKYVIFVLIGFILGYLLADWLDRDSVTVRTITEYKTDTLYIPYKETVTVTKTEIVQEYLRDTILIEPFKPQIKAFKAVYPFLYGNAYLSGEVLGEVLKTSLTTDFNIPSVTNTITTTNTVIKKPSGLFLTAGVNSNFQTPYLGAIFVKDKYLVGLNTSGFQVGYKLGRK